MSLFIAVCDDEKRIGAELETALMDILGSLNIKYEIDVYFTGEELCSRLEAGAHYNLIFLDIEFAANAINGVEVGKFIREKHRDNMTSIVYISWEQKYSMQLFDIRPLSFLIKPLEYKKVEQVIQTYLETEGLWAEDFTYKIGHDIFKVKIRDILYLQSVRRKIILHFANGKKEEFYGTLKTIYQEQLQRFDFLFIHSAYVVNFDYVESIKYNELTLAGSKTPLPISQHRRKEVREKCLEIMKKRRA